MIKCSEKKHTYRKSKIPDTTESMISTDHRELWQNINKHGPKQINKIPNTVYTDGLICDDEVYVLDTCRNDIESLYNPAPEIDNEFDDT